jgi:hypothetical protein
MMNRFFLLTALATSALFAADAQAQLSLSSPLASQNQSAIGTSFTYTRMGMNGAPVSISVADSGNSALGVLSNFAVNTPGFLAAAGPLDYSNARFKLDAVSGQSAASTPIGGGTSILSQSGFSGTFSIIASDNTTNLLSGTFTGGTLTQVSNPGPPGTNSQAGIQFSGVTFTSDIFKPLTMEGFSLTLAATPDLMISGTAFQNFTANTQAGFSAAVIPEPATLAMAGFGLVALPFAARVIRRRRSS